MFLDEDPCNIWFIQLAILLRYSSFCKFQDGGRRPSCFANFTISGYGLVAGLEAMLCIKFGRDRINGSKVIAIFLSHRKCITGTPKMGFFGVLGVKT